LQLATGSVNPTILEDYSAARTIGKQNSTEQNDLVTIMAHFTTHSSMTS